MRTEPMIRLRLFFARDAARAVILRQGPSKVSRLILWDRDTDRFEDGQWLKHKVYPDACDLSPDGRHFLYFALNGDWGGESQGAYTANSRPPDFTALALFPEGNTWGGSGRFLDSHHYFISSRNHDIIGRDEGSTRVFDGAPGDDASSGPFLVSGAPARLSQEARKNLDEGRRSAFTEPLDRYETQGGRLFRIVHGDLELIRDFSDMSFEPIRAPYDWRGDSDAGERVAWHPLDEDRP